MTNSRRKGKYGELEVVAILKEHGLTARRGAPMQAAGGRPTVPDVVVDGAPVWLEVKRGKLVNVRAAMRQALQDAPATDLAAVVHRDDRGEWMLTARLEDVLELVVETLKRTEVVR